MKGKKNNNSLPEPKAVPPLVSGAAKIQTLAACSKRPTTTVDECSAFNSSIPREIVYHILSYLPASVLQENAKFVWKEWNAIISNPAFIKAHLLQSLSSPSTTGFLVQDDDLDDAKQKRAFHVGLYDRAISELRLPFQAIILSSCNGLLLLQNAIIEEQLCVVNLITKAHIINLPSLSLTLPKVIIFHRPPAVLAFAPSSGRYKVFCACVVTKYPTSQYPQPEEHDDHPVELEVKVMVWTIGVDETWRAIDFDYQGITMSPKAKTTLGSHPFSIAGGCYICWFHTGTSLGFALDIDAETMYQFGAPEDCDTNCKGSCWIPMDTGAGIVHKKFPTESWKVWELIGLKTGPWGTCMNFDAAVLYSALDRHFGPSKFEDATPFFISLKTGEFWLYGIKRSSHSMHYVLVCYNWKTGSTWSSPVNWRRLPDLPLLHVNSLVSPKNL